MTAEYRMLHYVPDAATGARFALGAVVRSDGAVRLVHAPHLPDVQCLGSRSRLAVARLILDSFDAPIDFDAPPIAAGPLAHYSPAFPVPRGQKDPDSFVRQLFRADQPNISEHATRDRPRRERQGWGRAYFQRRDVGRFVRDEFKPVLVGETLERRRATGLRPISHYVLGSRELVLLEPVSASTSQWRESAKDTFERFSQITQVRDRLEAEGRLTVMRAYIIPGLGARKAREEAARWLRDRSIDVVDCDDAQRDKEFIDQIRTVGESGDPLLPGI
jgi:hypothetical protein